MSGGVFTMAVASPEAARSRPGPAASARPANAPLVNRVITAPTSSAGISRNRTATKPPRKPPTTIGPGPTSPVIQPTVSLL